MLKTVLLLKTSKNVLTSLLPEISEKNKVTFPVMIQGLKNRLKE